MNLMKHFTLLLTLLFFSNLSPAQTFEWALGLGASDWDHVSALTSDANGNVYAIGYFSGTADFDPSGATFNLTSNGNSDIFIQKLSPTGSLIWAQNYGGNSRDIGSSVLVDFQGNIVVSGHFQETVNFNPLGSTSQNRTSAGNYDGFVMKLNANGEFIWIQQFGGTDLEVVNDLAEGQNGDLFMDGVFRGTADFDPSASTFNLTSNGSNDAYVARLNSNGDLLWASSFGSPGVDAATSIAVDPQGNVYAGLEFNSTVDFDPSSGGTANLTSNGGADCAVLKLNESGNYIWARSWGSPTFDVMDDLTIGSDGQIYSAGYFSSDGDFDPNPSSTFTLNHNGNGDVFVHKLDSMGNFQWAHNAGGPTEDEVGAIAADAYGNIYVTGYFNGSPDFNPSATATNTLTSVGGDDIFIWKLNANGEYVDALSMGGNANEIGHAIAIDGSNNILHGGIFRSTADLDPSSGVFSLTSNGNADGFILKLGQSIPLAVASIDLRGSAEADGTVSLNWESSFEANQFTLERSSNGWHWETLAVVDGQNAIAFQHQDMSPLPGINLYRVGQFDVNGELSFSNQVAVVMDDASSVRLTCYPNPVHDQITIEGSTETFQALKCSGLRGKDFTASLRFISVSDSKMVVDLSELPQGIYFFQAGAATSRIVKL